MKILPAFSQEFLRLNIQECQNTLLHVHFKRFLVDTVMNPT
jgi:hypothetical protein